MLRWGRQAIEGRVLSARGVKQHIIFSTSDDGAKKAIAVGLHADELQRLLKAAATMFVACTVVWLRKWRSQFK